MKKNLTSRLAALLLCACPCMLHAQPPGSPSGNRPAQGQKTVTVKMSSHSASHKDTARQQVFKGKWTIPGTTDGAAEFDLYEKKSYDFYGEATFGYGHFYIMRGTSMMDEDFITKASVSGNKATLAIRCGRNDEDATVVLVYDPNTQKITVESNTGADEGCFLFPGIVLQKK